jgi:hypothetical protein
MLLLAAIPVTNASYSVIYQSVEVSEFNLISSYPKCNLYIFFNTVCFISFLLGLSAKLPVCHIE